MFKGINFVSPETILIIPIAILLDASMFAIGILGDWWGVSDYGLLGVLGWIIIGGWAYIRKFGVEKPQGAEENEEQVVVQEAQPEKQPTENKAQPNQSKEASPKGSSQPKTPPAKTPTKTQVSTIKNPKAAVTKKLKEGAEKLLARYGVGFLIKGVPIIGDFWPGFTIFVFRELKS